MEATNKPFLVLERSSSDLSISKSDDNYVLQGVFTEFGVRNKNNRIYEEADILPHIDELNLKIKDRKLLGELDHPKSFDVSLKNASHVIEELRYDETSRKVMGKIRLLNTTAGKEARAFVDAGIPLHISSRAAGVVEGNGRVKLKKFFTYDLVADPGFNNAELNRINESYGLDPKGDVQLYEVSEEEAKKYFDFDYTPEKETNENMKTEEKKEDFITREDFEKYTEALKSSLTENFQKVNEKIANLIKADSKEDIEELEDESEKVQSTEERIKDLEEVVETLISNDDQISESLNDVKEYASMIATSINESFGEGVTGAVDIKALAEKLESHIAYTSYLAENLDNRISYQDYVNEQVDNMISHSDYLVESLDSVVKYAEHIKEGVEDVASSIDLINESKQESTEEKVEESKEETTEKVEESEEEKVEESKEESTEKVTNEKVEESKEETTEKVEESEEEKVEESTEEKKEEINEDVNESVKEILTENDAQEQKAIDSRTKYPFYNFLNEAQRTQFDNLIGDDLDEMVRAFKSRRYFGTRDVQSIWESVIHKAEKLDWLANMPSEFKPIWEGLSAEHKLKIKGQASIRSLDSDYAIRDFWETRDLRESKVDIQEEVKPEEGIINESSTYQPSDEKIKAIGEELKRRMGKL